MMQLTPRLKVAAGCVLALPGLAVLISWLIFAYGHPELTQLQVFNRVGWMPMIGIALLAFPLYLIWSGFDDDAEG